MSTSLRHVGIVVSNLEEALKLYQEYLECELVTQYTELKGEYQSTLVGIENVEMRAAILRTQDNNRIELLEYVSHPGKKRVPLCTNDIGASHFAMTVEDLQRLYDRRTSYEVQFISPPLRSPDGFTKVAYAVLMEECIVELVEVLEDCAVFSGGNCTDDSETRSRT